MQLSTVRDHSPVKVGREMLPRASERASEPLPVRFVVWMQCVSLQGGIHHMVTYTHPCV
jgi:hypothetical protein